VFWVISVYFNIRNTLPESGTFLLGQGKNPCYPLNRRLSGLQSLSGYFGEENILLSLLGTEPCIIQP